LRQKKSIIKVKLVNKIKSFDQWVIILAIAILTSFLVVFPITIKIYQNFFIVGEQSFSFLKISTEIIAAFLMQYLFSLIFLSLGTFGLVFWTINLLASFLVSYFFITFGKNLDCWVISDILENISGLTFEYLSAKTVL
jgi:hypothetical protein